MKRPIIIIPTRKNLGEKDYYLDSDYSMAIYKAGGAPLLVPLIPEKDFIENIIKQCQGICLSGSNSDVSPSYYGTEEKQGLGPVQPLRDKTDILLLKFAFDNNLPVLAICYGIQILNVFCGGTLIQDLSSSGKNTIVHSSKGKGKRVIHKIMLQHPSPFDMKYQGKGEVTVNSSHHQAIEKLGPGLKPFAWAPDGVIEGVYLDSKKHWVVGIQWHPENIFFESKISELCFQKLIENAKRVNISPR